VLHKITNKVGWGKTGIRRQMYAIYLIALLLPISVIGILLIVNTRKMLNDHYIELLESDNLRVKTLLSEMTTQVYNISEDICFDSWTKNMLTEDYAGNTEFCAVVNSSNKLDSISYSYQEIEGIYIYTDNPTISNYKQYHMVTDEIKEQDWYQRATGTASAFWVSLGRESTYSTNASNLCLIRRMTLPDNKYNAVIVIRISDQYIRSRIDTNIIDAVSVDDSGIVYSSKKSWYGEKQLLDIDYSNSYFTYSGTTAIDGTDYFISLSTSHLYMTSSKLYVCTLNNTGFENIEQIINVCILILLLAIVIPGIILVLFTNYFTGRIYLLREEMHKASTKDYGIRSDFGGHDELTDAFEDLKIMVQEIKDKDAQMYEAKLNEKELRNEQQVMEYKMLASQINPHFLYNALETIRMKAITNDDREVATAIKVLGKTLRYVLENTGTSYTTLKKELNHVENYLTIQKLRFGSRVNYNLVCKDGLQPEQYAILPLLLQPVVENAVVHGLENIEGNGQIQVEISRISGGEQGEKLLIAVQDNGNGMSQEELDKIRKKLDTPNLVLQSSIGLYNINQRIKLCYGPEYGMEITSRMGQGTCVILMIPAILNGEYGL
jgi:two-component system sensor histidine kinase YesM